MKTSGSISAYLEWIGSNQTSDLDGPEVGEPLKVSYAPENEDNLQQYIDESDERNWYLDNSEITIIYEVLNDSSALGS